MKSNSVSNVFGAMTMPSVQETGAVVQPEQSFGAVLSSQTEANAETGAYVMDMVSENGSLGEVQQTYEKECSEASYREIATAEDSSSKQVSTVDENKEELEDKVTKLLSEELDISEEELEEIMSSLGITLDSLINGTGLKDLMMELTGAEDMAELLLNDTFGNLMKELELLIQDFSQQLAMTPEELKAALAQLETTVDVLPEGSMEELELADGEENLGLSVTQQVEGQGETEETGQEMLAQDDAQSDLSNVEDMANVSGKDDNAATQQVTYREVQTTVNAVGEQVTQVVEQNFVDAEDIMRQITEFTKVTVQQTQSSIEMQLNPAHLGKIYLQVAEKNGVITAQLAAENEVVKQALETQLATLRENMSQQGLKVEAVEVTVASHEFEQNLEGNQHSAQENEQQENHKTHRFLTADNLDELSGLMSEEEKIAAQMMLDNGNSMDVTA